MKAVVLVSGGSDFSDAQIMAAAQIGIESDNQASDEQIAKGVDQHYFSELKASDPIEPTFETITISKANAKGGSVTVLVYTAAGTGIVDDFPIDSDAELGANDPTPRAALRVIFLGSPSKTVIDTEECLDQDGDPRQDCILSTDDINGDGFADLDTKPDVGSTFQIEEVSQDTLPDGVSGGDGEYTIDPTVGVVTTSPEMVMITATIKDNNARLLRDGDEDIDSTVTFEYEYAMGSSLKPRRNLTDSQEVDVGSNGTAVLELDEWKSNGAISVTVTAMYSGPTGTLDLGEVTISRGGDPTMIVGAAFSVGCLVDKNLDASNAPASNSEDLADDTFVMKDNKACVMDARFGREQTFIVKAHLEDALGTVVDGNLSVSLDTEVDNPLDPADGNPLALPRRTTPSSRSTTIDDEAMFGDHTITYASTEDDVEDFVITVQVAGPPYMLSVSGPDTIALDATAEFTVTAVDSEGGIPDVITTGDDKNDEVAARVLNVNASNVEGIVGGMIELDDMGMATITHPRCWNH